MDRKLSITGPFLEQTAVCAPILHALPNWFGIEEAVEHYLNDIATMPTWLAQKEEAIIGFLTLNQHFPNSAEIHVMGVLPDYHRMGVRSRLITADYHDPTIHILLEGALLQPFVILKKCRP